MSQLQCAMSTGEVGAWFQWCGVLKFEENWALPPVHKALLAIKLIVMWLTLDLR